MPTFLVLNWTGERHGNRLKHSFKCVLDTSVLGTIVLTLPRYVPYLLSRVSSLYGLLYTWLLAYYGGCNLDNKQQTIEKYKLTTSVAYIDWKISQMEAV